MIVLGVLLILIAVGATVFALSAPSGAAETIEVTALGFKVSASPLAMFFAGAVAVILLSLGLFMVSRGARRKASARKELHQLRKEQAAGANVPPTAEGEGRSRRDRRRDGSSTDTGTDTSSTGTDTETSSETRSDSSR